ncbi:Uncharacterised protein [Alloiococcus otitis]|uniref:Uncharacterized protein n=1 Tax=Alloiococcus otitis ATCC 51267 TaxID=883081 RepID=K9EW05_9LACT|nr:hypothetical protein [Alloiococcus otitis]EKU93355.1 hypothetical protein HMPREF9698_01103 [Alloiococcus otitis ATCC 51267]SUU81572.1 Uncharacterised protein [Alloiococcus otitis]
MELRKIVDVNNCLNKLLEKKLNPQVSFKIIRAKKDLEPYVQSAVESLQKYANEIDDQPQQTQKQLISQEESKILDEKVDYSFKKQLVLDDLPDIEGYVIEGILPLVKEETLNE